MRLSEIHNGYGFDDEMGYEIPEELSTNSILTIQ
jgi:hypothetical protein